jgi:transposase-like protein
MSAPRRRFGTDQKATILKRYLVDKVPISDLRDEYGIKYSSPPQDRLDRKC